LDLPNKCYVSDVGGTSLIQNRGWTTISTPPTDKKLGRKTSENTKP